MRTTKKSNENKKDRPVNSRVRHLFWIAAALAIAVVVIWGLTRQLSSSNMPADANADTSEPGAEQFLGRWQRPDGGYILEIRNAEANGELDISYFNPRPINIGSAKWWREDGVFKVFVELRDTYYPGSTYTLDFDPAGDRLFGYYFQAPQGQTFLVEFTRLN